MGCRDFDEYINLYIDDMLHEQDKERFEQHLSQCSECRKSLEDTNRILSMVRNLDEEPLPEGFRENLFRKLEERGKPITFHWLKWVGVAAGIAIILFSIKAMPGIGPMDRTGQSARPTEEMVAENSSDSDQSLVLNSKENRANLEDNGGGMEEDGLMDFGRDEQPDKACNEAYEEEKFDLENSQRKIQTDIVEVHVQDVCITPQTLKLMAINNGLELVESDENFVVIEIVDDEQRSILFDQLSKMGEVKEVGQDKGGNRVKIFIKSKE